MVVNNIEIFLQNKKNKKRQCARKRYRTLPEDVKQGLVKYRKNYSKIHKEKTD